MPNFDYDVLVIGSGFGGSVAALRAAEKGYKVGVLESGRRFPDEDVPQTQWNLPGFLWFPGRRVVWDPTDRVPRRRADPVRRRGRWRLTCLRQHPLCPTEEVLRRPGVGGHHRLG
ncbi:FAD-binding protein [Streptomyces sp. LN245]|uniref:FAD-binding protein n=1 Tax=Streptomyces sp. LN245 TaxID=3112975 RepID=UPI003716F41E